MGEVCKYGHETSKIGCCGLIVHDGARHCGSVWVEVVQCWVEASVPFYRKGDGVFPRTLAKRLFRIRSLVHERQVGLIGWAPTAKSVGVTVWLSCTGSLDGVWLGSGGLVFPRFFDLAKIGLANGQPGSDTKFVATGFPGLNSQKMALVLISPRITVS